MNQLFSGTLNGAVVSTPKVRPISSRIRCQLGIGLLLTCLFPMALQNNLELVERVSSASQFNTLIANACAVIVGYTIVRRLTRFPGVAGMSFILPTFAVTFGVALCTILLFRLDYSRFFLLMGFFNAQLWFHLIYLASSRFNKLTFAVVPFGNASRLPQVKNVRWDILSRPRFDGNPPNGLTADLRADLSDEWEAFIAETAISGIPVYHYKQIGETLTGKVEIEHLSENNLGSLLPNLIYLRFKQWLDIAGAVLLLPLLLPLFAIIAIMIRIDSSGPVFFRQPRMGYQGRIFSMWKFRTMHHCQGDPTLRSAAITQKADSRITRVGHFLRKTRLDELPQIINILRGEMSWIGPRPEAVPLSRWYEKEIPFYRYRHIVRPGISGWAQVNQGHVAAVDDVRGKLHYDFYYIKNFSVWLDILIAIRTAATVVTGFGAR